MVVFSGVRVGSNFGGCLKGEDNERQAHSRLGCLPPSIH